MNDEKLFICAENFLKNKHISFIKPGAELEFGKEEFKEIK